MVATDYLSLPHPTPSIFLCHTHVLPHNIHEFSLWSLPSACRFYIQHPLSNIPTICPLHRSKPLQQLKSNFNSGLNSPSDVLIFNSVHPGPSQLLLNTSSPVSCLFLSVTIFTAHIIAGLTSILEYHNSTYSFSSCLRHGITVLLALLPFYTHLPPSSYKLSLFFNGSSLRLNFRLSPPDLYVSFSLTAS